jgi:hypothetical protein
MAKSDSFNLMETKFFDWLVNNEGKSKGTANAYTSAIRQLSIHYSDFEHKPTNLFSISSPLDLEKIAGLYDSFGKYSAIGDKGHRTYINGIRALIRFRQNNPTIRNHSIGSNRQRVARSGMEHEKTPLNEFEFSPKFKLEAAEMSKHYEVFYCLERSIRALIVEAMESYFGADWWQKRLNPEIRENVSKNIKWEADTGYTRRSASNIDYTTFGELRQIVKFNWDAFSDKLTSLNAFNSIMITLNTLRVPIAHCTPLAEDEVLRLHLAVKDWFRLIEKLPTRQ